MKNRWTLALACSLSAAALPLHAQEIQRAPAVREDSTLRVYDVSDLVARSMHRLRDVTLPTEANPLLKLGTGSTSEDAEAQTALRRAKACAELASLCATFLQPPFENGANRLDVTSSGQQVVALLNEAQHAWLADFLSHLRSEPETTCLMIVTHLLTLPEKHLAELGLGDEPSVLTNAETESAFLAKVKALDEVDLLRAPDVTLLNGQLAIISVLNQTSYIKRFDVIDIVEPGRQRLIDPVIDIAQDGLDWELRAVLLPDGTIGLDSQLSVKELVRPMAERKTEHGVVGVPEVKTTRVQSRVRVKPGQCIVLTGHPTDGKRLVLMLRADRVVLDDVTVGAENEVAPGERKR